MKTLTLVAHPRLQESRVNRTWKERLEKEQNITVHDLYQTYPTEVLDVEREQRLLTEHDRIVFQFPFYWHSTPPLLKNTRMKFSRTASATAPGTNCAAKNSYWPYRREGRKIRTGPRAEANIRWSNF
ncbi:hypothetical protein PACILC2_32170 [Paenibacillus cisolokensis]|uniref:Flavodoxin-like fold domain-containing protein n=1 Tax=Paenibacillus cisolokensis TaxID=1658519 RepID=A0ABQ4N8U5_9BACL|nr:hypothetical protein PACILC2_32170 [Paenibacillus cisolokensis]